MTTMTEKQLGQLRPANTTAASLYSPASGNTVNIRVSIANTGASPIAVRLFHDDNGTTYDETTALAWDISIKAGQVVWFSGIHMGDASGNLAVRTDTANDATFTAWGTEIT